MKFECNPKIGYICIHTFGSIGKFLDTHLIYNIKPKNTEGWEGYYEFEGRYFWHGEKGHFYYVDVEEEKDIDNNLITISEFRNLALNLFNE